MYDYQHRTSHELKWSQWKISRIRKLRTMSFNKITIDIFAEFGVIVVHQIDSFNLTPYNGRFIAIDKTTTEKCLALSSLGNDTLLTELIKTYTNIFEFTIHSIFIANLREHDNANKINKINKIVESVRSSAWPPIYSKEVSEFFPPRRENESIIVLPWCVEPLPKKDGTYRKLSY